MSQQMPPDLASLLQGAGGGGGAPDLQSILQSGGAPPPDAGGGGDGGLNALQQVIQLIPSVMSALPDPRDTQDVAKCLQILTGIQTRLMQQGGQGGAAAQTGGY